jgi:hypothetical protein
MTLLFRGLSCKQRPKNNDVQQALLTGTLLLCCLLQVPFHWFVPLMAFEVATHAYGSYVFDLQPRYWFAVRYFTGMLIAMGVAASHNVLGRKQFYNSQIRGKAKAKAC